MYVQDSGPKFGCLELTAHLDGNKSSFGSNANGPAYKIKMDPQGINSLTNTKDGEVLDIEEVEVWEIQYI